MNAFAESEQEFYNLGEDAWGSFRLKVGHKDVTGFRDIPAQVRDYQLTEPYGYGPATFALPALSPFDTASWGSGDLKFMGNGHPQVDLVQVSPAGTRVRTVWAGFCTRANVTDAGVILECDGRASGRLAMRIKTTGLMERKRHVGRKIFDAMANANLRVTPFLGGDIGVQLDDRGISGSVLDHIDSLLAATVDTDGSGYTLMPTDDGKWLLAEKNTTTTHFTAYYGAHGVKIDLADDMTENPNVIVGHGVTPEGLVWNNAKYPQMIQGDVPDYPMNDNSSFGAGTTDADTDSGDGVTVMLHKLGGTNYLPREDRPGGFDSDVTQAIKDLQDDAGLTQSGNMNPNTWNALFDLGVTGQNTKNAYIAPLAIRSEVREWDRTANGSIAGRHAGYDPSIEQVHRQIDYGTRCPMPRARRNARGLIAHWDGPNWAGTVTLTSDVFAGERDLGDPTPELMSRFDINAGMNFPLKNFGDFLFHVSVVNVTGDGTVVLGVDTRARNAAELGEIIARRIESRTHPARQWKRFHLTGVNSRRVEASVDFGVLFNKVELTGGQWNIVEILAGEAGSVSRVRIETTNEEAAFCVAFTAQKTSAGFWASKVGDPFVQNAHGESKWTNSNIQHLIDRDRALLGAWGDGAQPGGYHPRAHTNPTTGEVTDAPITGLLLEDAGFDYHTFADPVVYMAIYPDRDCVLKPQRILWAVEESDA